MISQFNHGKDELVLRPGESHEGVGRKKMFAAMRHKLLPVSAGYATICKHEKKIVCIIVTQLLKQSVLVRSVELCHLFNLHSSSGRSWLIG